MSAAKIIFITGTDTGVGKTVLTALLLHHLRGSGVRALAMKPFCSGGLADVRLLQSLQRGELLDHEMNPFYFAQPLAPLVAARKGAKPIRLTEVVKRIRRVAEKCDFLLIEGSGGLLVPLGPGFTVADLIRNLNCQVLVAGRNQLGTINHTLLTVSALRNQGIPDRKETIVLLKRKVDLSSATNPKTLARLLPRIPLFELPHLGKQLFSAKKIVAAEKKCQKVLERIAGRAR